MALTATYTFEEGSNGAAVTTACGATSVGGSPVYSTAAATQGSLGMLLSGATTDRADFSATSAGQVSFYTTIATAAAGNSFIFGIMTGTNYRVRLRFNPTNTKFEILDTNSVLQATSTASYTVGQLMRIDTRYDGSNGSTIDVTMRIFLDPNSGGSTPDDTVTATGIAIAAAPNSLRFTVAQVGWSGYYDTIRTYDDTTVWPDPYGIVPFGWTGIV